ncbi:MAG: hypothetical protein EP343_18980 [Deltaproteobacteria bacterium]|nr:MAG: hypothetical protein EP343_18980 [Deltaproteobacteria bacterium]
MRGSRSGRCVGNFLQFGVLWAALLWSGAGASAQTKQHPLADVFPQRTLMAVVAEQAGRGLQRLSGSLASGVAGIWGTQQTQEFENNLRRDLAFSQPPSSWSQWLSAMGVDPQKPAGVGLLYSTLMRTAGPLLVMEMDQPALLHKVLRGDTGRLLMQPFWRACHRRMLYYARRYLGRRGMLSRAVTFRRLHRSYSGGSFFRWCRLMRPCKVSKGKLVCRSGQRWLRPKAWLPLHWKSMSWRVSKQRDWKTFGSEQQGFFYAIWKDKYVVVSSHTYFLNSAIRDNSLRMPLGQTVFFQNGGRVQTYVSHLRVRMAMRAMASLPKPKRMPAFQMWPSWALTWLARAQAGLVVTRAALLHSSKGLRWVGQVFLTRNSPFHGVFRTEAKPLDDGVGWVPEQAKWVLMHRALRSFVSAMLPVRRSFSARGMVMYSLLSLLGKQMSLSILPGRRGPFRLLVQLDITNAFMFRRLFSQAHRVFPGMAGGLQTTTYRGYTIKKKLAGKGGTSVSMMLYQKRLVVGLEPGERDSTLLQTMLDWVVYQPHSLLEKKPIQRALQTMGVGQAILYAKKRHASSATSRPSSQPFANLSAFLGGIQFLPSDAKKPSSYKFQIRVTE